MGNCQSCSAAKEDLGRTKIVSEVLSMSPSEACHEDGEASLPENGHCDSTASTTCPQSDSSSFLAIPRDVLRVRRCPHEELGAIHFQFSSLEEAKCEAVRQDKPILLFEIEIPGNQAAGKEIFSHPLIVEAAESLFVSVRQNSPTKCSTRQQHPSLRSPPQTSVRVLDGSGIDMLAGICDDQLSLTGMVSLMVGGLRALRKSIPLYLMLLEQEEGGKIRYTPSGVTQRIDRQAVFAVPDANLGEMEFADLDGIIATRAGFIGRHSVVQVTYDSTRLSYCNIVRFALQRQISSTIYYQSNDEKVGARMETARVDCKTELVHHTGTIQPGFDPKHALRQTLLRYVPLTDLQATKANRLVAMGVFNEATHILSPRQGMILMKSMQNSFRRNSIEVVDMPIIKAWEILSEQTCDAQSTK